MCSKGCNLCLEHEKNKFCFDDQLPMLAHFCSFLAHCAPVLPAGQQPQLNRAPAALGAPPGEEAFPPQAPTVPAEAFMQFEGSVTTETPNSDWSSLQGPSPTDTDVWSVTTGAPSLVEQEAASGLKTPQQRGRGPATPVPERILLSSAGHCRTAAPCFYAVQIGNRTGPGHPPHRGF